MNYEFVLDFLDIPFSEVIKGVASEDCVLNLREGSEAYEALTVACNFTGDSWDQSRSFEFSVGDLKRRKAVVYSILKIPDKGDARL